MITLEKIDQLESISKQILDNSKFTKNSFDKITISTSEIQAFFTKIMTSTEDFLSEIIKSDGNIKNNLILKEIEDISYQINLMALNLTLESSKYGESQGENISDISKNIQSLAEKIKTIVKNIQSSDEVSESENNNFNSLNNLKNLLDEKEKYKLEFEHIIKISNDSKEVTKKTDSLSLELDSITEKLSLNSTSNVESLESEELEIPENESIESRENSNFTFKTVTRKQGSSSEISKNFFEF